MSLRLLFFDAIYGTKLALLSYWTPPFSND